VAAYVIVDCATQSNRDCAVHVVYIQLLGVLSTAVLRPTARARCSEQERADIQRLVSFLALHYQHVFKVCHVTQCLQHAMSCTKLSNSLTMGTCVYVCAQVPEDLEREVQQRLQAMASGQVRVPLYSSSPHSTHSHTCTCAPAG